ncbi:MAG: phosphoglycolate phosphatase [Alphaproteobacteria bacterium]|nr:phosphoglycolate phosphatase [Alphaproteobacteria bacterium]
MSRLDAFRAVVFDLDGTLIDSAPDVANAVNRTLAELGRPPLDFGAVKPMIGDGVRPLLEKALSATGPAPAPDQVAAGIARYLHFYRAEPAAHTVVYPGVRETLRLLADRGLRLGVCSNKPHEMTVLVLEALGLAGLFRAILGGGVLPVQKPDPGHLGHVLALMAVTAAETAFVGDSEVDMAAARNGGVRSIAVGYGYARVPASELDADILIQSFSQVPDALARLGVLP